MSWDAPEIGPFASLLPLAKLDEHAASRAGMGRDALARARSFGAGTDGYRRWSSVAQKHADMAAQYRRLADARRRGTGEPGDATAAA